ncbi:hypothetical protein HD597_006788 [Nonomuraea thailandensis]|uniref:Uncharacterized protein n=1 Tax=Nonomuraea thailandensis TaxID=1188745 RepID=A0A9X2K476_9ACTN|nr:hypothetical protein [Nonomuraea thailandensis]MCP2359768.1 hypothetical protein [Nonomuraea thailandensis]
MTERVLAQPSGCRWCGLAQYDHFQRWSREVGFHRYAPPTQDQIKQRMKARRTMQGQRASHVIIDEATKWPAPERTDMPVTEAPYDERGNLMHYPKRNAEWRPNEPFTATLRITGWERGRSAARFFLADQDDHEFPMFLKDLCTMLNATTVSRGTVTGRWHVVKRGENYGLSYLGPADDDQAPTTGREVQV